MRNDSTTSAKVKEQIARFNQKLSDGLSRPVKKFFGQMLFGIQAGRDVKLSNIARNLNEPIKLIKTENRLSRNISKSDYSEQINQVLIQDGQKRIGADTVLCFDLTDVNKPFAKKMENLSETWDGSKGCHGQGYWISSVVAAEVKGETVTPLYSGLYSSAADDFVSENDEILKAIRQVNGQLKGRGIWAIDRGGDRHILVDEMMRMGLHFVIRAKINHLVSVAGKEPEHLETFIQKIKYTKKMELVINREGCDEKHEILFGSVSKVMISGHLVTLVVIKGFGEKPMILMTNVNKSAREILEIYLTRWKCEESFRFLKQEYHLEDVRVRKYIGLRNMVAFVNAVYYFLSVYLGQRAKMNILFRKLLVKARRFFETSVFKQYALADGIYWLLFNTTWDPKQDDAPKPVNQLELNFWPEPSP
jgi:hypothetical protein